MYICVNFEITGFSYKHTKLSVMPGLCADAILGHDILGQHSSIELVFGGSKPSFNIRGLSCAKVPPAFLFSNLSTNCRPIAIKSRQHTPHDEQFIKTEIDKLQAAGMLEPEGTGLGNIK